VPGSDSRFVFGTPEYRRGPAAYSGDREQSFYAMVNGAWMTVALELCMDPGAVRRHARLPRSRLAGTNRMAADDKQREHVLANLAVTPQSGSPAGRCNRSSHARCCETAPKTQVP
jgi:hypothetical protein